MLSASNAPVPCIFIKKEKIKQPVESLLLDIIIIPYSAIKNKACTVTLFVVKYSLHHIGRYMHKCHLPI